jgi:hypothetical protein
VYVIHISESQQDQLVSPVAQESREMMDPKHSWDQEWYTAWVEWRYKRILMLETYYRREHCYTYPLRTECRSQKRPMTMDSTTLNANGDNQYPITLTVSNEGGSDPLSR